MKKTSLFTLHSLAGLISGCFILLMSLSGAFLVFHDELDAFQQPIVGYGHEKKVNISVDRCYHSIQMQYPHAEISSCNMPGSTTSPLLFSIYDSAYKNGTTALEVFIDPQTGVVLASRGDN